MSTTQKIGEKLRNTAAGGRLYEDFQPASELIKDDGSETLVISLPGFKKEQMRVQLDSFGNLHVKGERRIDGDQWSRFAMEVPLSVEKYDLTGIRARFDNETLYVTIPTIASSDDEGEKFSSSSDESPKKRAQEYREHEGPSESDEKARKTTDHNKKRMEGEEKKEEVEEGKSKTKEDEETRRLMEKPEEKVGVGGLVKESYMHGGGGMLMGLNESRQMIVNVVVGLLVVMALIVYVSFSLRRSSN